MKVIKKYIDKMGVDFKSYLKKHLVSNFSLLILACFFLISDLDNADVHVFSMITLFTIFSFNIEARNIKDLDKRIVGYIASYAAACLLPIVFDVENNPRIVLGIHIIFALTALYKLLKKEKNIFSYLHKVFFNLCKVGVFYAVISIGISIIYIIFEEFIYTGDSSQLFFKAQLLLITLFLVPFSLFSFVEAKDEVPKLINILINKVLAIIMDILYLFVYIYIIKILILRDVPNNEVFAMITFIFAISLGMLLLLNNFNDKLSKFNTKYIPYLFIAPLILQSYALIIRISNYGLTTSRYIGICILLFEVSSMILYLINNKKYLKIDVIVLIIICVIMFLIPIINMEEAPILVEVGILKSVWKEDSDSKKFTNEEKTKIKSAYDYLYYNEASENYLPDYLTFEKINEALGDYVVSSDYNYYIFDYEGERINISDYGYFEEFSGDSNNAIIKVKGHDVNFEELFNDLVNNERREIYILKVDEETDLFVKNYEVQVEHYEISYAYVTGYILTK